MDSGFCVVRWVWVLCSLLLYTKKTLRSCRTFSQQVKSFCIHTAGFFHTIFIFIHTNLCVKYGAVHFLWLCTLNTWGPRSLSHLHKPSPIQISSSMFDYVWVDYWYHHARAPSKKKKKSFSWLQNHKNLVIPFQQLTYF